MFEIVYRYDPRDPRPRPRPTDPATARQRLEEGNARFAALLDGSPTEPEEARRLVVYDDLWDTAKEGPTQLQQPFAAVLGCADARVPTEIVFGEGFNDLFVVRVAGNVLGSECLGSLDYALSNLGDAIKLVVVLGHSRCGAVTAAVDSFLDPERYLATAPTHPIRAVVDKIMVAIRAGQQALESAWGPDVGRHAGYREALIATAVGLNTALTAATVRQEFRQHFGPGRDVVYGVYDLTTRRVGVPIGVAAGDEPRPGLISAPADLDGFHRLGVALATAEAARRPLGVA